MTSLLLLIGSGLATPEAAKLVEGNATSAVRVVIYEDLQCPDCAGFRKMLDEKLLPKYGGRVAFEHRDFPLAKHSWARRAAIVGRHFQTISAELSFAWRRETMARMKSIKAAAFDAWVEEFATRHKQDGGKAIRAAGDAGLAAAVEADFQEGVARGIARTPTALVNGEAFIETFTAEEISQGIERALKENGVQ